MFSEILPNVSSTIVVLLPLMIANSILLEAALSYLGAGVHPAQPVLGHDGKRWCPADHQLTLPSSWSPASLW